MLRDRERVRRLARESGRTRLRAQLHPAAAPTDVTPRRDQSARNAAHTQRRPPSPTAAIMAASRSRPRPRSVPTRLGAGGVSARRRHGDTPPSIARDRAPAPPSGRRGQRTGRGPGGGREKSRAAFGCCAVLCCPRPALSRSLARSLASRVLRPDPAANNRAAGGVGA